MRKPWVAGRVLTPSEFGSYCKHAMRGHRQRGIRLEDYQEVLLDFPLLMTPGEWPRLARLTEKLAAEVLSAERELLSRPELYPLLGLKSKIEKILQSCEPDCRPEAVPRVMRFDFLHTTEGWLFSESNPDVAGGYFEAYKLTEAMAAYYPGFLPPPNPAAAHAEAIRSTVGKDALVAFVCPFSWHYYAHQAKLVMKELEMWGIRGIMTTPRSLRWESGFARVLRSPLTGKPSLVVRQLLAEGLLKLCQRSQWAPWFCGARTPVSNPCHSILTESKRFPCVLKELDAPMPTYRRHSPESRSPTEVSTAFENQWVFKPAFGAQGRRIAIAGVTPKSAFKAVANKARRHPVKWVAQRRFQSVPVPTERGPGHICLGIYTVDGVAAGLYARIKGKPLIDQFAMSIPVLIPEGDLMTARKAEVQGEP